MLTQVVKKPFLKQNYVSNEFWDESFSFLLFFVKSNEKQLIEHVIDLFGIKQNRTGTKLNRAR